MSQRHRILLVDDHPTNLEILEEILGADYELTVARTGEECLALAPEFQPDLVLLDIMMPGIDGYETCRRLRADSRLRNPKVIMLSAKAMVSERLQGYEAGANDYLTKPFDEEELLAKVRVFLRLRFAEEVLEARTAGMSEIATGVLHNVGNVLNSVNVSVEQASGLLRECMVDDLMAVAQVLVEHRDDLSAYVSGTEAGRVMPDFVRELSAHVRKTRDGVLTELEQLSRNVRHIAAIIRSQQSYASSGSHDSLSLSGLVEDALALCRPHLEAGGITVQRSFETLPPLVSDRHRLLQIVVNLVRNAADAMTAAEGNANVLRIAIAPGPESRAVIRVTDDGVGIKPQDLSRIFGHGFTTKKEGHGFGLHASAIGAAHLGGTLRVESEGPGRGATFTLELPLRREEEVAQ